MTDFYTPFIILTLLVVIIIQAVDRYFVSQQNQEEVNKMVKAFLAKNAVDYTVATRIEKTMPELPKDNPDEAEPSELSDTEFDKHIKQMNK